MPTLHQANVDLKVTETVCGFVALATTVVRLYLRRARYWWDDAWVVFSAAFLLIQIAGAYMHVDHYDELSKAGHIAAYYILATTFYCIIWSARLSILFSIIRIDPDPVWQRRLKYIAVLFFGALLFFLAQIFWVCEPQRHRWGNLPSPQCTLGKEVAICQLVSDIIADLLLIVLPIRLIRGITDKGLRRRLVFIFSTSIVTTIVSLVHAAYIIRDGKITVLVSALVEDTMSLTVANFPVVVTALLRRLGLAPDPDARAPSTTEADDASDEGKHWAANTFLRFRSRFPSGSTTQGSAERWAAGTGAGGKSWRGDAASGRWGGGSVAGTGTTLTKGSVSDVSDGTLGTYSLTRPEKLHVLELGTVEDETGSTKEHIPLETLTFAWDDSPRRESRRGGAGYAL